MQCKNQADEQEGPRSQRNARIRPRPAPGPHAERRVARGQGGVDPRRGGRPKRGEPQAARRERASRGRRMGRAQLDTGGEAGARRKREAGHPWGARGRHTAAGAAMVVWERPTRARRGSRSPTARPPREGQQVGRGQRPGRPRPGHAAEVIARPVLGGASGRTRGERRSPPRHRQARQRRAKAEPGDTR